MEGREIQTAGGRRRPSPGASSKTEWRLSSRSDRGKGPLQVFADVDRVLSLPELDVKCDEEQAIADFRVKDQETALESPDLLADAASHDHSMVCKSFARM